MNLELLIAVIEEKMSTEKALSTSDIKNIELKKVEEIEKNQMILATKGNINAREFVKNKIFSLVNDIKDVNQNSVDDFISQYHIDYYKNIYSGDNKNVSPVEKDICEMLSKFSIDKYDSYEVKLQKLTQIIYQELYGYSILDELIFETELDEVAATRYDYIWLQYKGIKKRFINKKFTFANEDVYKGTIENRMLASSVTEMQGSQPQAEANLECGHRVYAIRPPLATYHVVSVRLLNYKKVIESNSKFMPVQLEKLLIRLSSKGKANLCVIGAMGSGKTTLIDNIVINNIANDTTMLILENEHELRVGKNHPEKNSIEMRYFGNYDPSDLTVMGFRLNRDVMIYGEVRAPREASEVIKAMLRNSPGSVFSFHSSSTKRVIHDLRQLLMQTSYYKSYKEAQFDAADAIDIIIQIKLNTYTGKRYIYKISESIAYENMEYEIRDLFVYDKSTQKYKVHKDGLSKQLQEKCLEYDITEEELDEINKLFKPSAENSESFIYEEN